MILSAKNFILFILIAFFAMVFGLHWFFVDKTMPVSECLSIDCIYSSPQAMPQEFKSFLPVLILITLLSLFATAIAHLFLSKNELEKTLGNFGVFRERDDTFKYKLNSWLKILEKRDPEAAGCPLGLAARVSDFRQ